MLENARQTWVQELIGTLFMLFARKKNKIPVHKVQRVYKIKKKTTVSRGKEYPEWAHTWHSTGNVRLHDQPTQSKAHYTALLQDSERPSIKRTKASERQR